MNAMFPSQPMTTGPRKEPNKTMYRTLLAASAAAMALLGSSQALALALTDFSGHFFAADGDELTIFGGYTTDTSNVVNNLIGAFGTMETNGS